MEQQIIFEEWAAYAYELSVSMRMRQRRSYYEELRRQVPEGQVLLARCMHYWQHDLVYLLIESFVGYDELIERSNNLSDPLCLIDFLFAAEIHQDSAV